MFGTYSCPATNDCGTGIIEDSACSTLLAQNERESICRKCGVDVLAPNLGKSLGFYVVRVLWVP
jgi:hypothetical protein